LVFVCWQPEQPHPGHFVVVSSVCWCLCAGSRSSLILGTLLLSPVCAGVCVLAAGAASSLALCCCLQCVLVFVCWQPEQPHPGHFVRTKFNKPVVLEPIPYEFIA